MNEEQAQEMIALLTKIISRLDDISSNTSPVYDNHDICTRLDSVVNKLEDVEDAMVNS